MRSCPHAVLERAACLLVPYLCDDHICGGHAVHLVGWRRWLVTSVCSPSLLDVVLEHDVMHRQWVPAVPSGQAWMQGPAVVVVFSPCWWLVVGLSEVG